MHPRARTMVIVGVMVILTAVGVVVSATSPGLLPPAETPGANLSVDEAAYYEYVAPRLDKLLVELDAVIQLTDNRSRDVVALGVRAARIEQLIDQIRSYGDTSGIPERFGAIDDDMRQHMTNVLDVISEARHVLTTFDFARLPGLSDAFGKAFAGLTTDRDRLQHLVAEGNAPLVHSRSRGPYDGKWPMMRYHVTYMVDGEERTTEVDVATAAEAAEAARQELPDENMSFELIQVHLLDEMPETPVEHQPET